MIDIKYLRYILAILFIVLSFHLAAKGEPVTTLEDGKAHYILEVIKHITWPNDSLIAEFKIVILSKDNDLLAAFNNRDNNKVRGKNIRVQQVEHLDNIDHNANVIVVSASKLSDISEINQNYSHALIISDGHVNKQNLIVGLLTTKKEIKLTINRENIVSRGFDISNNLLDFAGTKDDLVNQLADKDNELKQLIDEVKSKEDQLTQLNQSLERNKQHLQQVLFDLSTQNNQLIKAHRQLATVQEQLASLQASKEAITSELVTHKNSLIAQQQLITEKEVEQKRQQKKLTLLNQAIAANKATLNQQIQQLEQQSYTIEHKEQKINQQRTLLYVSTAIALVILLLIVLVLRINIKRKQTNKKLYELATTDGMTKLFNRRHFLALAQRGLNQLHRTKSIGVMLMIDIDHFKKINDSYGHAAGDQAIKNVAKILQGNLRDYDIVGRIGGEEFAMFLPNSDIDTATQVAERIRLKSAELVTVFQQASIKLTVSVGFTSKLADENNIDTMLHRADKALYQAKNSGRNKIVNL